MDGEGIINGRLHLVSFTCVSSISYCRSPHHRQQRDPPRMKIWRPKLRCRSQSSKTTAKSQLPAHQLSTCPRPFIPSQSYFDTTAHILFLPLLLFSLCYRPWEISWFFLPHQNKTDNQVLAQKLFHHSSSSLSLSPLSSRVNCMRTDRDKNMKSHRNQKRERKRKKGQRVSGDVLKPQKKVLRGQLQRNG